jgi:hypothetical protein
LLAVASRVLLQPHLSSGKEAKMQGKELIETLISATGLPDQAVDRELQKMMSADGIGADELTLERLRELIANYLQDVLVEAKDQFSK